MQLFICLLILISTLSASSALLLPNTLLSTTVACVSTSDCRLHYNYTWCQAAGVVCIHSYCRLIPGFPCKTTHTCLEEEKRCIDKTCKSDAECDNGLFCDGTEVCQLGICVTDAGRPSCYYTGGLCDEATQQCYEPKARLAWRSEEEEKQRRALFGSMVEALPLESMGTTNTSFITQTTVNVAALSIVVAVIGALGLFGIVYVISHSIRKYYRQKRYTTQ